MFENLRQSLDDLLARATRPEDRRAVIVQMKEALVHARVGLDDLRGGVRQTRQRLESERRELATIARRKSLAEGINDAETVAVAARFEQQHAERVRVLEAKLQAQEAELALAEHEVEGMTAELRGAISGGGAPRATGGATGTVGAAGSPGAADPLDEPLGTPSGAGVDDDPLREDTAGLDAEIDAVARAGRRARMEQEADARLAELKRRMGK